MADEPTLGSTQVGRCGEVLVQYQLLRHGIESAAITTNLGIDLVAYSPWMTRAFTVEVRTDLKPKPAGPKGMALDWWLSERGPAELVALVELQHERIWALRREELVAVAQEASGGRLHVFLYTESDARPLTPAVRGTFDRFLLRERIHVLFGHRPGLVGGAPPRRSS